MRKITKLMLTLMLLCVAGMANAAETVIKSIDYSTLTSYPYYKPDKIPAGASYDVIDGVLKIENTSSEGNAWDLQPFIIDQFTVQEGLDYIVKIEYKTTAAGNINIGFGNWTNSMPKYGVPITVADDFQTLTLNFDDATFGSENDNHILWQCRSIVGTMSIRKVEVIEVTEDPTTETSIYSIDYSTQSGFNFWNGSPADVTVGVADGQLNIVNEKEQEQNYTLQLHIGSSITTKAGLDYIVKINYKTTTAGSAWVGLGNWSNRSTNYNVPLTVSDEFQTVEIEFKKFQWSATDNFVMWQSGKLVGTISIKSVEVIEIAPADPLALPKEALQNAIAAAEAQNPFAKTAESWSAMTEALAAAQEALADEAATEESLEAATAALNEAMSGLQLTVGYSNLTADMFMHHESLDATEGTQTGCAYVVGSSTGQPYGDGSVSYLNWADLSGYSKLIILVADGTPRIMMNRLAPVEGGDANGGNYVEITDAPVNGIVEVDLTQYDYAHLNAIKGANWQNVTVTGMYLYKEMSYAIVGDLTGGWGDDVEMTATENEGEYTLTVENVVVGSTEAYKYKLRANGNWNDYQLPAGSDNALWTPEEGIGYYTLTFTANVLNHTLNCVGEKTADFEYAVVGCTYEGNNEVQSELFAGSKAWDTNTTDIMTKQNDGTYVWEKKEIVLPAKWIDLKVVARDGENVIKWYGNNGQNVGLNINETGEGIYNVTVTFDGSNVTATAEKKRTFTVAGDNTTIFGTAYDANATANDMTLNDDGIYVKTYENVTLPICTIKYKVVEGRSSWIPDGIGNDLEIGIKMAGTYDITFSIDPTNKTISHVMSLHKSIGDAGYATYCSPYDLNFAETGVTAYIAKVDDSKIISFEPVTSAPANTGLLLKADKGTYKLKMETSTQNVDGNVFTGVNEETLVEKKGIYVLLNGNQGVGFYKTTANSFTVSANTAYIDVISGARSFIALDGEATAIEGITAEKNLNGEVYNLQGQRVMKAQKGLYIINGKKVVVK